MPEIGSELSQHFELEITVLSPLHVGSGRELLRGYDFVAHQGRTWRIDEDALLEAALGGGAFDDALMRRPAAELLRSEDFEPGSGLFRYVIEGTPHARSEGSQVVEQVKDAFDRPYLPGSSLKGALRTVLAWGMYDAEERQPDLGRLKRRRSWAAQPLEQALFGRDPNHDWLRALRVRDSAPLPADEHLALQGVRIYPTAGRGGPGLDVDVEAVKRGAVFRAQLTLESYGFESGQAARLGWRGKRRWVKQLPLLGKRHAQQRLLIEANYFRDHNGPPGASRFYYEMIERLAGLPQDTFLVQVGWGAGWESKTLGSGMVRQHDAQFERLVSQYRMTKERDRRPGDPFPRSRHLALVGGRPALPMGWVEVRVTGLEEVEVKEMKEMKEMKEPPARPAGAAPGQHTGRLKTFFPERGFGFITPDEGRKDIFVHVSGLSDPSKTLREGQRLAFDVEQGRKGPRAVNVRILS